MKKFIFTLLIIPLAQIVTNAQTNNSWVNKKEKNKILHQVKKNGISLFDINDTPDKKHLQPIINKYNKIFDDNIILLRLFNYNYLKPIDNNQFYNHFDQYLELDMSGNELYYVIANMEDSQQVLGTIEQDGGKLVFSDFTGNMPSDYFNEILGKGGHNFQLWIVRPFTNNFVFIGRYLYGVTDNGLLIPAANFFSLFSTEGLKNRYLER